MMRRLISLSYIFFLVILCAYQVHGDAYDPDETSPTVEDQVPDSNQAEGALLSTQILKSTAQNCRKQVIDLHHKKAQVSTDKRREYSITLGIAAEKCDAVTRAFLEVEKASKDYDIYMKNLHQAEICVGESHADGPQVGGHHEDFDQASQKHTHQKDASPYSMPSHVKSSEITKDLSEDQNLEVEGDQDADDLDTQQPVSLNP